jgi:hypothetical protein
MGADTMTDEQLFIFKDDVNNIVQSLEIEYNGDINTMVINFQKALEVSKYSSIFTPMSEEEAERISQALMEAANQQDNNDNSGDGNTLSKEDQSELDRLNALEDLKKTQSDSGEVGKEKSEKEELKSKEAESKRQSKLADFNEMLELKDAESKEQSELAKFQQANQQKNRLIESLEFLKNGGMLQFGSLGPEYHYFKSRAITPNRQTELKLLSYAFKVAPEGPLPYIKSASTDPLLISEANSIVSVYDKAK